jgi:exopolysaccharide biosynthesis polyprenyl glycosylphosphotransferase
METTVKSVQVFEIPTVKAPGRRNHVPSPDWIVCLVMAGDFVVLTAAFALAVLNRQYWDFGLHRAGFIPNEYFRWIMIATLSYLGMLHLAGAFEKHLFLHKFQSISIIFKTSSIWTFGLLLCTVVLEMEPSISRLFAFWAFVNSFIFLCIWRLAFRQLLFSKDWATILRDRVLVVGWSKETDNIAKQMNQVRAHPYQIIGCTPSAHGKFWVTPPNDIPILGDYNSTRELLLKHKPNILIMADLDPVMGEIVALAQLCTMEHVQFKVIPSFFQIFASGLHLENISGVPIMGVSKLPLAHLYNRFVKRLIDIVGALIGLILSAPLILIFGILIYRESPGPIFYSQIRSGKGRDVFKIYKLRSMKLNAEANGPQWTIEGDPRRLKIGELMRRLNIDEVPQFWNVLRGDMSLVGPRPERPELIQNFKEEISHYNARHIAKPGITGYAQVNGMRGNTDLRERVRYDLYYVENWSVWLDMYIMLKTFLVRNNAY